MKHVGEWVAAERKRRRLSTRQVAVLAGYRHVGKGERRIARFEQTGNEVRPFMKRLLLALGHSLREIEDDLERQRFLANETALRQWMKQHGHGVPPTHLVVRCFAGMYVRHRIDGRVKSMAEAIRYARWFSCLHSHQVCLPLGNERSTTFDERGRVTSVPKQLGSTGESSVK